MEIAVEQLAAPPRKNPAPTCINHPNKTKVYRCLICGRPVCSVCAFSIPSGELCPSCMCSGRRAGASGLGKSLGALGCSMLTLVFFVVGAVIGETNAGLGELLMGIGMLGSIIAGLALGLVAQDECRRSGSPLGTIGVVVNGLLLGGYVILVIVGLAS